MNRTVNTICNKLSVLRDAKEPMLVKGKSIDCKIDLETVTILSRTCFILTIVFLFELCSRMLCAQWTYHVTPARLLVRFLSISHVTGSGTCVSLLRFRVFLTLPIWTYDMSLSSYASPFTVRQLVISGLMTSSDSFVYLWLVCLLCMFVLVSRRPLYIWLGMGTRSPSSIYFATTLKV